MVSKFMLFLISSFVLSTAVAAGNCRTDAAFSREGWKVHASTEFARLEKTVLASLQTDAADFALDMKSRMMSKASERPIEFTSMDRISTSRELMWGDVVTILDLETAKYSELRWFDGKTKHLVYNAQFQKCAMDMVPMAVNALF